MDLGDYLTLFPGASREKARFMALAGAVLRQAADLSALAEAIQPGFSFALAEGSQLDALGEAAGAPRENGMDDEEYRDFLLAKLALWGWDGTNRGVPAALGALPGVALTDNGDGTVTVSPPGTRQDLLPVAAGIRIMMN